MQYWKQRGISGPVEGLWTQMKALYSFSNKPQHLVQMQNYRKYGRIYGIFFGLNPQLSVAEPHILRKILVKDFNMFHNRKIFLTGNPLVDNMLTILRDDDWKRIRCIVSPTFTSSRMRKMSHLVKECAEKFVTSLKKIVNENKNSSIDCKKYFSNFTIDVIASAAFGTKLNSLDEPNNEFVRKARKATNNDVSYATMFFFIFPRIAKFLKIDAFGDPFNFFKEFILHVINQREKEKTKANDFLQLLLDAQKGILEISHEDAKENVENEQSYFKILPKHKTMSIDEMMSQCTLFLFAGNETTVNTLAFAMYYLAMYPEYQDKLIREIDEVWKTNDDINFDVINKMQYLDAVINETLRIEPVGLHLLRKCTEDYELNDVGIKIPKGMNIIIPIYSMHRDKEFFPNPEKFDPERFMPENRSNILPYTYLPFGDGPRNCIGMRFALMVLKMCVIHIFRDFRVVATEETKKPLEFFLSLNLLQPKRVMVKFEKRD